MPFNPFFCLRFIPVIVSAMLLDLPQCAQAQSSPVVPTVFDSVYSTQPVELVYMAAFLYAGGGQVHWITRREANSDHFLIEQSSDGQHWQSLAKMPAHPGSQEPYGYVYYDMNLRRYGVPVVHYRVRQVALDSSYTYSPTRAIWLDKAATRPGKPTSK